MNPAPLAGMKAKEYMRDLIAKHGFTTYVGKERPLVLPPPPRSEKMDKFIAYGTTNPGSVLIKPPESPELPSEKEQSETRATFKRFGESFSRMLKSAYFGMCAVEKSYAEQLTKAQREVSAAIVSISDEIAFQKKYDVIFESASEMNAEELKAAYAELDRQSEVLNAKGNQLDHARITRRRVPWRVMSEHAPKGLDSVGWGLAIMASMEATLDHGEAGRPPPSFFDELAERLLAGDFSGPAGVAYRKAVTPPAPPPIGPWVARRSARR
jgi:hypothetical protein